MRQTEEWVSTYDKKTIQSTKKSKPADRDPFLDSVSKKLRDRLSTKVTVKEKGKGGEIRIEYYSDDDLERLIQFFDETD